MEGMAARAASAKDGRKDKTCGHGGGYGEPRELTRTDAESGFEQTLWLPEGFDFRVLATAGGPMSDGGTVPLGHGAMACFATGEAGVWRLLRNHEERSDPFDGGGVTTMSIRWEQGAPVLERAWRSLSGTLANRAGGPTPWGSWLSCEATTAGTGGGRDTEHGYVFEVPSHASREVAPVPLKAMGRFAHEAVAVDPGTRIVYETEDRSTAGFYRFLPKTPGRLAEGGRLQMLKATGEWNFDTRTGRRVGKSIPVEWVDIDEPDPRDAEAVPLAVFNQGWARGAAVFGRLEGCWWGEGAVYLASASGGDEGEGQIWEYTPDERGGLLKLVFESPDAELLSSPDDVTVAPSGNLLLCEGSGRGLPAVRGLTRSGEVFPFAHYEGDAEWRGATFSPDGGVLFVNLRGTATADPTLEPGRTIAVWGPWGEGVL